MATYGKLKDILKQNIFAGRVKDGLRYLAGLKKNPLSGKLSGFSEKTEISGKNIYAIHQVYKTKLAKEARYEAHRKYIDLQYVWGGEEIIPIAQTSDLASIVPYDKKKDVEFFEYAKSRGDSRIAPTLVMQPGTLAIFYPSDAHAPGLTRKKRNVVQKTVVKVKI